MSLLGFNPKSLSRAAGLNETYVRDILAGKSLNPKSEHLAKLAKALGCVADDLSRPFSSDDADKAPPTRRLRVGDPREPLLTIDEVDISATGGEGNPLDDGARYREVVVARWQMPALVIRPYTSAPQDRIKIITVIGDSMAPDFQPGERVMVNLDDKVPSPPGVFAIWDGFGEVIKRAEMVPYSDPPTVRLISANKEYEPRELTADQVVINGRVLGKWKWT
jgi:phage repressor protein C with HTH and peptisase S24 domain